MADLPRLTVALTFDHDSISDGVRRGDSPVKLSHAEFGVRVGAPRILALLADRGDPVHLVRAGPHARDVSIVDRGDPRRRPRARLPRLVPRGLRDDAAGRGARDSRALRGRRERVGGARPKGWRAPYWSLGASSLELITAAGFRYDSSLMADDYRLYRVRHGDRHSVAEGSRFGPEGAAGRGADLVGARRLAPLRAVVRDGDATACPRRRRSSRSGPRSCATPGPTRRAAC